MSALQGDPLCSKGKAYRGTLGCARVQEAAFAQDMVTTSQHWPPENDLPSPWEKVDSSGLSRETPLHWGIFSPTIPYIHSRGVNIMGEISHSPWPKAAPAGLGGGALKAPQ